MKIAFGKNHMLALSDDGVVFSTGDNTSGQLGTGSQKKSLQNTSTT
jgi:alpha-tubulin suppressor-like RCC1 family protein